jgi:hypothetical protein
MSRLGALLASAFSPPIPLYVYPAAGAQRNVEHEQLAAYYRPYIVRGISHSKGSVVGRPVDVRVMMVGKIPTIHAMDVAEPTLSPLNHVEARHAQPMRKGWKAERRRAKRRARRG